MRILFLLIFIQQFLFSFDQQRFNLAVERYLAGDIENSAVILDSMWAEGERDPKVKNFFAGVLDELAEKYYTLKNFESLKVIVEKLRDVSPDKAKKWGKYLTSEKKEEKKKEVKEKEEKKTEKKIQEKKKKLKKGKIKKPVKKKIKKAKKEPVKKKIEKKEKVEEKKKEKEVVEKPVYYPPKTPQILYYLIFGSIVLVLGFVYFLFMKHQKKIEEEKQRLKEEIEKKQMIKEQQMRREMEKLKIALEEERKKELEKRRMELERKKLEEETRRRRELEEKVKSLEERIKEEKKVDEILRKKEKEEKEIEKIEEKKEISDVWKIKKVDIPISYPELEKMVKSDLRSMRIHGLWALGEKGGGISVDIIEDFLKNEEISFEERREALKALKKITMFEDTPQELKNRIEKILKEERRKGWII